MTTPWDVTILPEDPLFMGKFPWPGSEPVIYVFPAPAPGYPRCGGARPPARDDAACCDGGDVPFPEPSALVPGCAPSVTEKFRQSK